MNRREFLHAIAAAAAAGLPVTDARALDLSAGAKFYDGVAPFGNVSLLHFTDCHAQLLPMLYREPDVNLGVGAAAGQPPHLVGEHLLKFFGIPPATREAHAFTYLDFTRAAKAYGQMGGFAHLATLIKKLKSTRPGALLLDGGDTWQGSATSLWTRGQDMIDAQKLLGVDVMTGHWDFTYGADRVKEVVAKDFAGRVDFLAQNIRTTDFGDPVFPPFVIKSINGIPVAIVGQAFPYTPIANPRYFVSEWTFGIQEESMQKVVDEARGKGAQAVVLLSHNGMDVDLKMATRVTGIDVILGGHTHDGIPKPTSLPIAAVRPSSRMPAATANSWPSWISMSAEARWRIFATACFRFSASCLHPIGPCPTTSATCARRSRKNWTRSSPSLKASSTVAVISMEPRTS